MLASHWPATNCSGPTPSGHGVPLGTRAARRRRGSNEPSHTGGDVVRACWNAATLAELCADGLAAGRPSPGTGIAGTPWRQRTGRITSLRRMCCATPGRRRRTRASPRFNASMRSARSARDVRRRQSVLASLLAADQPQEVQLAALAALDRFPTRTSVRSLIARVAWADAAVRTLRRQRSCFAAGRARHFCAAVEAEKIASADLDPGRLRLLGLAMTVDAARAGAKLLAAVPTGGRQERVRDLPAGAQLAGDPARGQARSSRRSCAACHRARQRWHRDRPQPCAMQTWPRSDLAERHRPEPRSQSATS